MADIEEFIRAQKQDHPNEVLFATLDDLGQAFYTSGHSIRMHELDETEGYDLSGLPPESFEDGEHIGYLTSASEFFIRKGNFIKQLKDESLSDILGERWWSGQDDHIPSILTNDILGTQERIDASYVQAVPVEQCYEAICAFPNGYFDDDYSPFQNYILAKHLYEEFGFEFFGIGATYLGFMRDNVLSEDKLQELANFLVTLFDNYEGKTPLDIIIKIYYAAKLLFI